MDILFITSSRIGDAALSTGLLNYIAATYPSAKVTIACGPLAASLFEGYPLVERVIPMKKENHNKHWIKLWKQVVGTRWDLVVDLRNSAVSRLLLSRKRYIFGRHIDKRQHKVQQNAAVMSLDAAQTVPKLWFTDAQMNKAREFIPKSSGQVIGVGPTSNWLGKTWPVERFVEMVDHLIGRGGKYEGARVAVFAAPGEEEAAQMLLASIPDKCRIDVIAKTSPAEAAATISLCDFYLGNDSGLMHCAAACGVPTFGVFGPSYPHIYAPWGEHCDYARTPESFDELIDYEGYSPQTAPCLMESLSIEMVKEGLNAFLAKLAAKAA